LSIRFAAAEREFRVQRAFDPTIVCRITDRVHELDAEGLSKLCNGKFRDQFQHTVDSMPTTRSASARAAKKAAAV